MYVNEVHIELVVWCYCKSTTWCIYKSKPS